MANVCQIQIQPVHNGSVIQAVSVDGDKFSRKLVAADMEGLRKAVHEIADQLYVPRKAESATQPPTA